MLKILATFLFLSPLCCCAESFQLKKVLERGKVGEFVVAAHQKNYTLWHIKDRQEHCLLLEEISVPIKRVCLGDNGWQGWVDAGAPQHIGWVMYSLNLLSGHVMGIYSVNQGCWLSQEIPNRFLSTLLNVHFYPVAAQERRRMGKSCAQTAPYWNPPLFYRGEEVPDQPFDQYITRWPTDGTELSNKKVEIYLLQSEKFPSFFPYWLQVSGGFGKACIRIVDSGCCLKTHTAPLWKD